MVSYIYQMLKLSDGDLYNKDKRNKLMGPVKKKDKQRSWADDENYKEFKCQVDT